MHGQHGALDGVRGRGSAWGRARVRVNRKPNHLILALTRTLTLALILALTLALALPLALTWMVRPTRAVMALTQLAMTCTEREMRCSVASTWLGLGLG